MLTLANIPEGRMIFKCFHCIFRIIPILEVDDLVTKGLLPQRVLTLRCP